MVEKSISISTSADSKKNLHDKYLRDIVRASNINSKYNSYLYENQEDSLKIKLCIEKIKQLRKENTQLKKLNSEIYQDIINLQSNIHQMIPGYFSSNQFPSFEVIVNNIETFVSYDSYIFFKRYLLEEFALKGIVMFYKQIYVLITNAIKNHFQSLQLLLESTMQTQDLIDPVQCVIKKSAQANWTNIISAISKKGLLYKEIRQEIQDLLDIQKKSSKANKAVEDFAEKAMEILYEVFLSHPQIHYDIKEIDTAVLFDENYYESLDGNIPKKGECLVVSPTFYKIDNGDKIKIAKARVMWTKYKFPE